MYVVILVGEKKTSVGFESFGELVYGGTWMRRVSGVAGFAWIFGATAVKWYARLRVYGVVWCGICALQISLLPFNGSGTHSCHTLFMRGLVLLVWCGLINFYVTMSHSCL